MNGMDYFTVGAFVVSAVVIAVVLYFASRDMK